MGSVLWPNEMRNEITFDRSSNFVPSANSPVDARLVKRLSSGQGGMFWRLIIDPEHESDRITVNYKKYQMKDYLPLVNCNFSFSRRSTWDRRDELLEQVEEVVLE